MSYKGNSIRKGRMETWIRGTGEGARMNETLGVAIWVVMLALALPYVRRARHPDVKPLAAFMMFVILFTLAGSLLFLGLSWLALETGMAPALGTPPGALVFLALVFGPAFLLARWVIRRPPLERPVPK